MSHQYETAQREFDKDGFVALRQFGHGEELADLMANVDRFIRDVVPNMPLEQVYYEDKNNRATLKQIQLMGDYDPYFRDLFVASRFREVAEQLLDGPVVPKNLQYFNKPPGIGQPTPPHQDGYYFMLDPCEAVTMWFALDQVDEENGCVRYISGSHHRGMRQHARTETLGFSQGITDFSAVNREQEVAMPAQPGDLLVHHAMTIHRADGNHSQDRSRRALGFVYYSQRAKEDASTLQAYQRKLDEEMASAGRI
jgi:phytanoyl-CoA hydroxylase